MSDNMNIWESPNFRLQEAANAVQKEETSHAISGMFGPSPTSLIKRDKAANNALDMKVEKIYMQTSDACKKSFVIFDQTKSHNTVILHPSWLDCWSCGATQEPQTERLAKCLIDNFQELNKKAIETLQSFHGSPKLLYQDDTSLNYDYNMQDHFVHIKKKIDVSLKMKNGNPDSVCNIIVQGNDKTGSTILSSSEIESEFHEDTKEIDALLSSDSDLNSTGYSPGAASSRNTIELEEINGYGNTVAKRKFQDLLSDIDDDADSGPEKADFSGIPESQNAFQNCLSLGTRSDCHFQDTVQNADFSGESSSSVKGTPLTISGEAWNKYSCSSSGSSKTIEIPMAPAKRIKLKSNIQHLKNVISGGNCLDTAGLLTETVHYVKCLQSRFWDLEASRHSRRNCGHF